MFWKPAQEVFHDIGGLAGIAADLDGDHVVVRQALAVGNVRIQDVRDCRVVAVDARPFGADFLPVLRHPPKDPVMVARSRGAFVAPCDPRVPEV